MPSISLGNVRLSNGTPTKKLSLQFPSRHLSPHFSSALVKGLVAAKGLH
jgi:hypothetical protein